MGALEEAAGLLRDRRAIVALTGAGVSTESGLPDFRSSDGLYREPAAEEILSRSFFAAHPEAFWDFYRRRLLALHTAAPNAAHAALAALEAAGRLAAVATQNIDGLHQAAGSRAVRELHGNARTLRCAAPHRQETAPWLPRLRAGAVPRCGRCGRPMRPDIVLFEEPLDQAVWRLAEADVDACDALLVVGTSLRVAPACFLAQAAADRGVPVVLVNRDGTEFDGRATVVRGDAGPVLSALARALGASARAEAAAGPGGGPANGRAPAEVP